MSLAAEEALVVERWKCRWQIWPFRMILEEILADIGDAGPFQFMFTAVILFMEVVISWSLLQTAIIAATPDWWCVDPSTYGTDNMTLDNTTFQKCSLGLQDLDTSSNYTGDASTTTCVRYYDPSFVTIVSEWDLVCERKYIKAAINSIQMAGILVGALLSGQCSDTFGRRIICYVTMVLHAIFSLSAGFSTSWELYAVLRLFVGASIGSYLVLHYVYVIEFVRHTWRPYLASIPTWGLGAGLMCLTAWRVPNWKYLHFINAGLSTPFVLGWFISPESLRWLAAKGRIEEADNVVGRIAKINKRVKSNSVPEQLALLAEDEKSRQGEITHNYSYHLLCSDRRMALQTTILSFCWMSLSMSFYGIIFGVSALSGNVFLNMFLLSVLESPVTLFTSVLINLFGRRKTGCSFFLLASVMGFAILIVDRVASEGSKGTVVNIVATCSKLFIAGAWTSMDTYSAELHPTIIRALGMGAVNVAARIGGMLAPFILEMDSPEDMVRCYVIVGSIMAISGLSVLLLRETKGRALADTLHQEQKELGAL
ncbi:hypothetical protein BaRGS_00024901 [Batillaria attramentaria]|uniref:Major facilitator superfamily (MFS) profile domain-containing protein n=1 Tax=Batillaria attramentaria TaxID=370345 RepID=A0ABD0K9X1_9CAEN